MRKADRQTALLIQKISENLNTTAFTAGVVAESRVEPDVDLEKGCLPLYSRANEGCRGGGSQRTSAAK
jgi:hypothetical protein